MGDVREARGRGDLQGEASSQGAQRLGLWSRRLHPGSSESERARRSEVPFVGFFIESYAHDYNESRSAKGQKIRPEGELASYKAKYRAAKAEIASVLKECAELHGDVRWGREGAAAEEDEASIDVEEVACSICGVFESYDENDIVMCDRTGCFRAFHVLCTDPPMKPEDLGGPDDDWFCHQCNCIDNCLWKVNEDFDKDYTPAGWATVFADDSSDDDDDFGTGGGGAPGNTLMTMNLDASGSEADSDFDENAPDDGDDGGRADGDSESDSESGCSSESSGSSGLASDASGDDLANLDVPPPDIDDVSEANILEGPRKKAKVDYQLMNALIEEEESDDGGAYRA